MAEVFPAPREGQASAACRCLARIYRRWREAARFFGRLHRRRLRAVHGRSARLQASRATPPRVGGSVVPQLGGSWPRACDSVVRRSGATAGRGSATLHVVPVNLVLLEPHELLRPLPADDPRAVHVLTVLRRAPGDSFDVGVVDGPRGKATVRSIDPAGLQLDFAWGPPPSPLPPLTLLVGLARPQTARKILQEATTLGVAELHFVRTERAEPQYAQSSLWSSGEWRDHLCAGAAQAFTTQLPRVTWDTELAAHLSAGWARARGSDESAGPSGVNGPAGSHRSIPSKGFAPPTDGAGRVDAASVPGGSSSAVVAAAPAVDGGIRRLALDNYEATAPLGAWRLGPREPCVLAIGPERGWGPRDRNALRAAGFALAHLGPRVLRSETAVVAALAILRADSGFA